MGDVSARFMSSMVITSMGSPDEAAQSGLLSYPVTDLASKRREDASKPAVPPL